jgi:hypothetical protein
MSPAPASGNDRNLHYPINSCDFRTSTQVQAVASAVLAQMAAMIKNVSDALTMALPETMCQSLKPNGSEIIHGSQSRRHSARRYAGEMSFLS